MFRKTLLICLVCSLALAVLVGCKASSSVSGDMPVEDLMAEMVRKAKTVTQVPGWLNVTEAISYDVDTDNVGVLSNGTALPLEQLTDAWYHIDERGQVFEYVNTMTTAAGDPLQVSVFLDHVIINLDTNLTLAMNPYSLGALDYRFSDEMAEFIERTGEQPSVMVTDVDGRQAVVFEIEEMLEEPVVSESYIEPVNGVRSVACYDMETGLLFRLERIRIFADGSERTYYSTEITVEADAQPPQAVLDYMTGMK